VADVVADAEKLVCATANDATETKTNVGISARDKDKGLLLATSQVFFRTDTF
jgi:hypothetical protein